ncbi:glycosyltransferase [Prosthecomicrobium pneumaticum]|uniref:Glycosyltransferase subfamily 4-like N-terminal domain-containing protein n=1 Tax=Prosthecomicrobium pneumaticum TaxID=81895 RepID=A0A7W9CSW4_9HYPH|nr:glycosyltransferase [Prosthecomicrobium pneumaticum]MBB5751265.1 hypothetical protein [Prosthecomicrobium pneumaticum]
MIMPPWPKGGSANVFEASVAAHVALGRDVYVLLAPDQPANVARAEDRAYVAGLMTFPGALGTEVLHPPPAHSARLERWRHRLRGRRGTAIDYWAGTVAARPLPPVLEAMMLTRGVAAIHVHHCWNMKLALRLARGVRRRAGRWPLVVCETHDVQSSNMDVIEGSRWINRSFDVGALVAAENRMCGAADLLLHINREDELVFRERLPDLLHAHLPPTIAPSTEAALARLRGRPAPADGKLVYLATNNYWNIATASWLVEEVLPRAPQLRDRLRIYGDVREGLRRTRPELLAAHDDVFAGPVDHVADAYTDAIGILVPVLAGTGSSIKLLEGLCTGRPLIGTSGVVRGIAPTLVAAMPIGVHDAPGAFAGAALAIVERQGARCGSDAEVFDRHFSNAAYQSRFAEIIGALLR